MGPETPPTSLSRVTGLVHSWGLVQASVSRAASWCCLTLFLGSDFCVPALTLKLRFLFLGLKNRERICGQGSVCGLVDEGAQRKRRQGTEG